MATEGEKVEQVPLKTDTDAETTETTVEEKKKEVPKKTWFFQKTAKKTVEEEAPEEEKEKAKKKCFWSKCSKKTEEGDKEVDQMTIGIDMQMRDEKNINDHVKIQFEDVFGEPDSFHSWDCTWRAVNKVFEWTRVFFYRLFALLICLPAAIIFGVLFGLLSALNVYFVMPVAKLLSIPLSWIAMTWAFIISKVVDPVSKSCGLCFSNMNIRKYGINNAPTDLMQA